MDEVYLILDIGTGNSRAGLVTHRGEILGIRAFENVYYRDFNYRDAQYFFPREWGERLIECAKGLLREFPEIRVSAVTATSARESIVLINREGKAFYGLPNIDNRGDDWVSHVPDAEEIYERTGRWVSPVFSALKLTGLRKIHRNIYEEAAVITSLSGWVGWLFTGRAVIEESQACETQLYDIGTHQWSEDLCRKFQLCSGILPEVVQASAKVGSLSGEMAEELGLSRDTVFIAGGADTQTAVKGIQGEHGEITIVSGTTSPIVKLTDQKFYDKMQRCWTDCYLEKGKYQVETNAGVSGLNYQRLKKMFFKDVSYEELDRRMESKKRIHCVASFGTLIFSENRALTQGGFYMPAPLEAACDKFDFAYACMADIVCSIYEEYKNLCGLVSNEKESVLGCGGGFQSSVMCRMLSDLTGKRIALKEGYRQASILGCVRLCNQALGIESQEAQIEKEYAPARNALLEDYYEKWKKIRKMIN